MLELATIVREAGPGYVARFGERMLPSHLRALRDVALCRTSALGGQLYCCGDCHQTQYGFHSCQNRACPKCQGDRTEAWLRAQNERLLPTDHFLLTFTLPAALRPLARAQQRLVYDALLRCAAETVLTLAADPKHLGARPAVLAVLHTHGRDLGFHPHAHLLVSAGGLRGDGPRFVPTKHRRFLFPGRVLSALFRRFMREALEDAASAMNLPDKVWASPWVVHVQHAGSGQQVLSYLGRYLFKSPLPNSRLERFKDGKVTFRFTSHRTRKVVHQTLPAHVFLHRVLQHVLPQRLHHVRGYGLLAPTRKKELERARALLVAHQQNSKSLRSSPHERAEREPSDNSERLDRSPPRCPLCKTGRLLIVARLTAEQTRCLPTRAPP